MALISTLNGLIRDAARSCLDQDEFLKGYLTVGDTTVPEANILAHLAYVALESRYYVWAQTPIKMRTRVKGKLKLQWHHLDMMVVINPGSNHNRSLLLVECKTLAKEKRGPKLDEVIEDFRRLKSWNVRSPRNKPLDVVIRAGINKIYGALIAIVPQERDPDLFELEIKLESRYKIKMIRPKRAPGPNISDWWKDPQKRPPVCVSNRIRKLQPIIKDAYKHDAIRSDFPDDGNRTAILYALFDFTK